MEERARSTLVDDTLAGLTRRQLEDLQEKIAKELQSCVIDGREGAIAYRVTSHSATASLMLCKPCFERYRLPKTAAKSSE